jgi:death on curing protein
VREPVWITRAICDAIHSDQIRQHGGRSGTRDENALESALARPRNRFAYKKKPDLLSLAASYAYGLARNHGYTDGNKRVAFAVMYTFLGLNGVDLDAPEEEVVDIMMRLSAGELTESALVKWLTKHCGKG